MATSVFINLPVKDLEKSKEFWTKVGYTFNAQFTDETAAALVISDAPPGQSGIYAMLLTPKKFAEFTKKEMIDSSKSIEVINALSVDSKEAVDEFLAKVISAGGKEGRKYDQYDFMYSRAFEDLDGHEWEILWVDPNHVQK